MGEAYNRVVSICLKNFPKKPSSIGVWLLFCHGFDSIFCVGVDRRQPLLRAKRSQSSPMPGGLTFITDLAVSSNGAPCRRFPCPLFKGKNTDIALKVQTDKNVAAGICSVQGTVGGIPLPWSVPAAAGFPQVSKAGNVYTYKMRFPVSSLYPSVRSTVTWKVNAPDGSNIFCFKMPVVLRSV